MKYFSVSAVIEKGAEIGEDTKIWYFSHVMSGAKIGSACSIGEKSFVGKDVIIDNNVKVGNNTNIYPGTIIKDNVFIGNNVSFTNVRSPKATKKALKFLDTIIESEVSVGAHVTIVGGVKIGKGSVIADGAVIIGDVTENSFVAGNPGKIKYKIENK